MSYTKQNFTNGQRLSAVNLNHIEDFLAYSSNYVTPLQFGAKGDGIANDTVALKTAIESGMPVYVPKGTYLLYEQIDLEQDLCLFGDGEASVIKLMPSDQTRPEEYDSKTVYNCYMLCSTEENRIRVEIHDLVIDANKEGYKNDVLSNGSSEYDHIVCLDLQKPKSVRMYNVTIQNALIEGMYLLNSASSTEYVFIDNCRFLNNGERRVDASGLHIEGNSKHTLVSNSLFKGNGFHGLLIAGDDGKYVNITSHYNGYDGICLWGGASSNLLNNIYCESNRGGIHLKGDYSPSILDETEAVASDNIISNLVTKNNTYGILFGNSKNTRISNFTSNDEFCYGLCSALMSSGNIMNESMNCNMSHGHDVVAEKTDNTNSAMCSVYVEFTKELSTVYPLSKIDVVTLTQGNRIDSDGNVVAASSCAVVDDFVEIEPNKLYILKNTKKYGMNIYGYDSSGTMIRGWYDGSDYAFKKHEETIMFPDTVSKIKFYIETSSTTVTATLIH